VRGRRVRIPTRRPEVGRKEGEGWLDGNTLETERTPKRKKKKKLNCKTEASWHRIVKNGLGMRLGKVSNNH